MSSQRHVPARTGDNNPIRGTLMKTTNYFLALFASVLIFSSASFAAPPSLKFTFKNVSVQGGDARPYGINDTGVIVGAYIDSVGIWHGMVIKDKKVTMIDYPQSYGTQLNGINAAGVMVGSYTTRSAGPFGFEYSAGKFTDIRPPASTGSSAQGINEHGEVVGFFYDSQGRQHGFKFDGHQYVQIDAPNGDFNTVLSGINDKDHIVVSAVNSSGASNDSFLLIGKKFKKLSDPNEGKWGTLAYALNNRDEIVGGYLDDSGMYEYGWLLYKGEYYTVNDPNSDPSTALFGMNDKLVMVGEGAPPQGKEFGFQVITKKE
jgi:probable HAF family extracellular repeat protein